MIKCLECLRKYLEDIDINKRVKISINIGTTVSNNCDNLNDN